MFTPLPNYLRTHRTHLGLSKGRMSELLGLSQRGQLSAHEQGTAFPTFHTTMAYEAIFRMNMRELFAGEFLTVEQSVINRITALLEQAEDLSDADELLALLGVLRDA